jgi:hypothetical protein
MIYIIHNTEDGTFYKIDSDEDGFRGKAGHELATLACECSTSQVTTLEFCDLMELCSSIINDRHNISSVDPKETSDG